MDQVTATALIVALVFNFVVLALAFGWAIRNRRRAVPHQPPVPARAEARPWWLDQAERAETHAAADAGEPDLPQPLLSGADVAAPAVAMSVASSDGSRAPEILETLEPATAWRSLLAREASRVSRYRRPATIVIADLEGTDRLAARLGAGSVDRLLPAVAATLRRETRATDRLVRLANGRFGVLLPETDEVAAINWVERVREATDLWLEASAVSLRLAFGWAELGPDADVDAILDLAYTRLDAERRGLHPGGRADVGGSGRGRGDSRPSAGRRTDTAGGGGRSKRTADSGTTLAAG
ncbi:MAG TPA: diguanylate cyclase [Candidatus Limnocylindrales bacterium]